SRPDTTDNTRHGSNAVRNARFQAIIRGRSESGGTGSRSGLSSSGREGFGSSTGGGLGCVGSGAGTGFGSVAAFVLMRGQPAVRPLVPPGGSALLHLEIEPPHQAAPLRLLAVDVGGVLLRRGADRVAAVIRDAGADLVAGDRGAQLGIEPRHDCRRRAG